MDAWPGFGEDIAADAPTEKGKGKAQDKRIERPWRFPVLNQGTLGAAILQKKNGRYEWSFAAEDASAFRLVPSKGPIEVFPRTRSKPWLEPKVTSLRGAEQSAHFLRTFYPDVDISSELIRDMLADDAHTSSILREHDVAVGNMIDIMSFRVNRKSLAYAVFPMGETGSELNLSALGVRSKSRATVMTPKATPVHSFETPILQIETPPLVDTANGRLGPALGVRTIGSTAFLQTTYTPGRGRTQPIVEAAPFVTAQRSDIGDRRALDISVSSVEPACGYIVNDVGDIFRCRVSSGDGIVQKVLPTSDHDSALHRITMFENSEKILYNSNKNAVILDSRTKTRDYELYKETKSGVQLLSAERPGEDGILRLVSTQEILWFDERNARQPFLAVKHGRDSDMTLQTKTYDLTSSSLSLLTSRRTSLVTVYDFSRTNDNLLRMCGSPYALPPIIRPDGRHLGHAVFQEPNISGAKRISWLQLSERGSVSLLDLEHLSVDDDRIQPDMAPRKVEWPPDVEALEAASRAKPDLGPLAARAHSMVNLHPAYRRMFTTVTGEGGLGESEMVFDVLEKIPTFWQEENASVEYALTTFDIAMRSGSEPPDASRNDWLTGSQLDCPAGYRAMSRGRIPRDKLTRQAPWHLDISFFIRGQVPEFGGSPQETLDKFARFDLDSGHGRVAHSLRLETETRSQLALDLVLASDVYLNRRPNAESPSNFDDDMLSISLSTQAMTLGEMEPPAVQFSFLRPIHSKPFNPQAEEHEVSNAPDSKLTIPLGVRLLLYEWDSGSEPREYVYRDPYDDHPAPHDSQAQSRTTKSSVRKNDQNAKPTTPVPFQRPPLVVPTAARALSTIANASSQPPPVTLAASRSQDTGAVRTFVPGSQPTDTWGAPPSSQEPLASTQVLPGPHGGRALLAKKKPVKKRLGGF